MKEQLLRFKEFSNLSESDGFGTSGFFYKKDGDVYNYFFNIENDNKEENGYHLVIGKYSENLAIEGAKNSYCVLSINKILPEMIEDIAIDREPIPNVNSVRFKAHGGDVSELMEYVGKCLTHYLELNSKVNRIYDEIQDNLELTGRGEYIEFMKSIILSYVGPAWTVQEGATKKSVLIMR